MSNNNSNQNLPNNQLRHQFPILNHYAKISKPYFYFDSAATSHKPQIVVDRITKFYTTENASSHSIHSFGNEVENMVENTRIKVAEFIGGESDQIIFTKGATESLNLVANSFRIDFESIENIKKSAVIKNTVILSEGGSGFGFPEQASPRQAKDLHNIQDAQQPQKIKKTKILILESEHHSNILPWINICQKNHSKNTAILSNAKDPHIIQDTQPLNQILKKPTYEFFNLQSNYIIDLQKLEKLFQSGEYYAFAFAHISNVLGIINPVDAICELCAKYGVLSVVDGTQAVICQDVSVKNLNCDYYAFSGHKMYGPTGIGVIYAKNPQNLNNYQTGGEMVDIVTLDQVVYKETPYNLEAGTLNFAGIAGLGAATDWITLNKKEIQAQNELLTKYFWDKLNSTFLVSAKSTVILSKAKDPHIIQDAPEPNRHSEQSEESHEFQNKTTTENKQSVFSIQLYGSYNESKIGIFSFNILDQHQSIISPFDIATILSSKGIAVRSGQHCAGILHQSLNISNSLRFSLACYNTTDEIDYVIDELHKTIKKLTS
jgi:cysteine desulfurase / selenocysteine lyase